MRVLHPICRICTLNRGNLVAVRQIESAVTFRLLAQPIIGHMRRMSKPDPTLAQISAQFTGYDVERSGGGSFSTWHFRSDSAAAFDSGDRDRTGDEPARRAETFSEFCSEMRRVQLSPPRDTSRVRPLTLLRWQSCRDGQRTSLAYVNLDHVSQASSTTQSCAPQRNWMVSGRSAIRHLPA
jgi:hypothetical protein